MVTVPLLAVDKDKVNTNFFILKEFTISFYKKKILKKGHLWITLKDVV